MHFSPLKLLFRTSGHVRPESSGPATTSEVWNRRDHWWCEVQMLRPKVPQSASTLKISTLRAEIILPMATEFRLLCRRQMALNSHSNACVFDSTTIGERACPLLRVRQPVDIHVGFCPQRRLCPGSALPRPTSSDYYSARNQFERFRGFLELISRFEFEFRRRGNYFFEGFEFLVC